MRNVLAFFAKELRIQFFSPVAYTVMVGFLMLSGFFFYDLFSSYSTILSYAQSYQNPQILSQINLNDLVLSPWFQNVNVILLLMIPLFTMRLFAEEQRQGTDELILTSPVGISEAIWGKFLAAVAFYALLLALTFQYPIILNHYGEIDWGKMATGYIGLFLMGTSFISLGLFASTLTRSQIVAAIVAFSALLIFWLIAWVGEKLAGTARNVLEYLCLTNHFEKFAKGMINTMDLIYFASFIIFFLFLSIRSIESTRWR